MKYLAFFILLATAALGQNMNIRPGSAIRFMDADSSNWVGLKGPSVVSSNLVWTLPAADGTAGQALLTDGAGGWYWGAGGGGGGGMSIPDTRVPFGDGAGGSTSEAAFTYDPTFNILTAGALLFGGGTAGLEVSGGGITFSNVATTESVNLALGVGSPTTAFLTSSSGLTLWDFGVMAVSGPINAYNATTWNGSRKFATEDAVRDQIETLGAGNVSKFGTPSDNQIGVWTGDGTLEGDPSLIYNSSTNTLSIGSSGNLGFGVTTIIDDNVGTTTLQNIDAIDGTTSATITTALSSAFVEDNAYINDLSDNILTGHLTLEDGITIIGRINTPIETMAGTVMNRTQSGEIYNATGNANLTFSAGTPTPGDSFLLNIVADSGGPYTITIPSAYNLNTRATDTSIIVQADASLYIAFFRESARWVFSGEDALTTGSGLVNVLATSPTIDAPTITGAITLSDNVVQLFNPGATNAGLNVGSVAGDPSAPTNGSLWYDSTANELTARINGSNVALGAGGGGSSLTATYVGYGNGSNALTGEAGFTYDATTNTLAVPTITVTDLNTTNLAAGALIFEGNTVDLFQGTFNSDPTADRTWNIPDADGYFMLSDGGPISSTRVPFGMSGNKITSESSFNYNSTTDTLAVPNLTLSTGGALGASTATTPAGGDNDTSVATTAYVQGEIAGLGGGSNLNGSVSVTVDGGGSVLTAGSKGFVVVPHTGTITGWSIVADQSGSVSFDVEKAADATIPSSSIVASAPPALSSDQIERSTTLTGWTTAITAFDVLEFEITGSPTSITRATLQIHYDRGTSGAFGTTVDGGGSVITAGSKGMVIVPFACTITGWSIIGDASGSIAFDVEKAADGVIPSSSIVASAAPALSSDQIERSTTLTGWTTAVAANDVIEFEVVGTPATITRATIQIHYTR